MAQCQYYIGIVAQDIEPSHPMYISWQYPDP